MSFWDLDDGGNAADTGTEYEVPAGGFGIIPDGSKVLALVDEARWDDKDGFRYVSLRWSIIAPDDYKNWKIFHKLWVADLDPGMTDSAKAAKKRDRHRRMLAAIDKNANGQLTQSQDEPTDETLATALMNVPMLIKCMIWEMDDNQRPGEKIRGNWIAAVAPGDTSAIVVTDAAKAQPARQSAKRTAPAMAAASSAGMDLDDDIPF